MERTKNPIFSSWIKETIVENHFQSLVRIALCAYANLSKKKKTYTGFSLPCGKVADLIKYYVVLSYPLYEKKNS